MAPARCRPSGPQPQRRQRAHRLRRLGRRSPRLGATASRRSLHPPRHGLPDLPPLPGAPAPPRGARRPRARCVLDGESQHVPAAGPVAAVHLRVEPALRVRSVAGRAAAVIAPFLVSLPAYGYEASSYLWRGYGMWPQLWGMWLLPLALATTWRAVVKGRSLLLAADARGAHPQLSPPDGLPAVARAGPVGGREPTPLPGRRLWRAAAVAAGAVAAAAWLLVPALLDQGWTRLDVGPGTFWIDSHGAPQVFRWLASGELLDHGRAPLVTTLAGLGALLSCTGGAVTPEAGPSWPSRP